jgi:hypothetical protein
MSTVQIVAPEWNVSSMFIGMSDELCSVYSEVVQVANYVFEHK